MHTRNSISTNKEHDNLHRPLVLHIRRLRQWYDKRTITQEELAALAGVSERQVRAYEAAREIPRSVAALVAIALSLRVPLEALIAPEWIEALAAEIDERRRDLRLDVDDE